MSHQPSETVADTRNEDRSQPPRISAAFLVTFDVRKGYMIAWQQAVDGLQLDGVVDYKSLPSGLHNVEEDLVYFVHEDQAGVSAFVNHQGSAEERNARMLAVGVLVPLGHGRMGKCWRYAKELKELARRVIDHPEDHSLLEKYWEDNRLEDDSREDKSPVDSPLEMKSATQGDATPNGYRSSRRISITTMLPPSDQSLSDHHPALSLPKILRLFGPLLFPLYRAALLRKRILFVGEAPVELACNFVYDLSVISTLPRALMTLLPVDGIPDPRLHTLFCVGVPNIPELVLPKTPDATSIKLHSGWVACTTDDVLATKPELFDYIVMLPSEEKLKTSLNEHPKIVPTSPVLSKAFAKSGIRSSQRDARRYVNLHAGLKDCSPGRNEVAAPTEEDVETASARSMASSTLSHRSVVEPSSWPLIAYTSLIWWASAGEKRDGLTEEEEAEVEQDARLLKSEPEDDSMTQEVAIVTYFHRLTTLIFSVLSDVISRADGNDFARSGKHDSDVDESAVAESTENLVAEGDGGEQERLLNGEQNETEQSFENVEVADVDMRAMGLDVWSTRDREFVEELLELWWGRKAIVRGGRVECCGVRIV